MRYQNTSTVSHGTLVTRTTGLHLKPRGYLDSTRTNIGHHDHTSWIWPWPSRSNKVDSCPGPQLLPCWRAAPAALAYDSRDALSAFDVQAGWSFRHTLNTIGHPNTNRSPTSAPNLAFLFRYFSKGFAVHSGRRHRPRESEGGMAVDGIVSDLSVPIYLPYLLPPTFQLGATKARASTTFHRDRQPAWHLHITLRRTQAQGAFTSSLPRSRLLLQKLQRKPLQKPESTFPPCTLICLSPPYSLPSPSPLH